MMYQEQLGQVASSFTSSQKAAVLTHLLTVDFVVETQMAAGGSADLSSSICPRPNIHSAIFLLSSHIGTVLQTTLNNFPFTPAFIAFATVVVFHCSLLLKVKALSGQWKYNDTQIITILWKLLVIIQGTPELLAPLVNQLLQQKLACCIQYLIPPTFANIFLYHT